jgi:c-di-GMP-binding flagellar brake protein YcgR
MERRKEPRLDINQEVTVTVLGEPDSPPFQAAAVDMSGTGMRILSPLRVRYQAAVKVQTGDLLLLGEVIRIQDCERGYMLALKLRHSVDLRGDLERLNEAIRREGQYIDYMNTKKISVRD